METFIEGLFAFCCLLINGVGEFFHLSYTAINVYAFCYVEPIFTAVMLLFAVLALFKIPVNRIGKWFFWIVVGCVIALFIIGFGYVVHDVLDVLSGNKPIFDILNTGERNAHIEIMFDHTQDWLSRRAKAFGISYYAINLIVYVLAMPLLCIGSYLVLHFRKPAPARA